MGVFLSEDWKRKEKNGVFVGELGLADYQS